VNVLVLSRSAPHDSGLEIPAFEDMNVQVSYCSHQDICRKAGFLENTDGILLECVPDHGRILELAEEIRSCGFRKAIFLIERSGELLIQKFREEHENKLIHFIDGFFREDSNIPEMIEEIEKGFIFSRYMDIFSCLENSLLSSMDHPVMPTQTILLKDRVSYIEAVSKLAALERSNWGETMDHAVRVGVISRLIAQRMGLDPVFCNRIELAAPLHDLGMTAFPREMLNKTGELTKTEWNEIRTHAVRGWLMLNYCSCPILEMASEICLTHHERWDGRGYPEGLSRNNIPTPGIITAMADSFDVMMSSRPYKKEILLNEAMDEVKRNSRIQFSPICSYALGSLREELMMIYGDTVKTCKLKGM